ncbi:hypothetical protein Cni_G11496 [Canna indica]|uniref:J domain-containing protein n=1 Tax=Canna indica TaxID=4628 RepID=A0AAQ3KAD4_9LILI|nr:hypothetical protein Cni_G11496 [Canna indica]
MANMAIDGRDGLGDGIPEGEWWLSVAVRLLKLGDLDGCKRFADRAMEADPLLDGIDQVIAVADVLLAGRSRIDNHVDWYGVLQLPHPSPTGPDDPATVQRQYRRLALLLHPDRTSVFGADTAYRLVSDAYSVLSDPGKKSVYDAELHVAGATATTDAIPSSEPINPIPSASPATTVSSFWTACLSCCHVHEYSREYVNRSLRCPICRRAFQAAELSAPPLVIPGTDMYHCSWGFFPLGYPGEPDLFAGGAPDVNTGWKPSFPTLPDSEKEKPVTTSKKTAAKKKVGRPRKYPAPVPAVKKKVGRPRKYPLESGNGEKVSESVEITALARVPVPDSGAVPTNTGVVIDNNEEAKIIGSESEAHKLDDYFISFRDVNASEDILGNLQNIPFLGDEEILQQNLPFLGDEEIHQQKP